MTAREAIMQGYIVYQVKHQRGYVSRKTTFDTAQVLEAQGRRKGQKYFLWPHPTSTQYCYRVYIRK